MEKGCAFSIGLIRYSDPNSYRILGSYHFLPGGGALCLWSRVVNEFTCTQLTLALETEESIKFVRVHLKG